MNKIEKNEILYKFRLLSVFFFIALFLYGFTKDDDKKGKKLNKGSSYSITNTGGKKGDAYRLNINNINIPINNRGILAAVNIPPNGTLGRFGVDAFLFSSGFFLSGYDQDGTTLWSNGVASASLVEDYVAGTAGGAYGDPNAVMYVVKKEDEAFGASWQDWKDAVNLGADFYDGDGDGIYNPVDKNGNGIWDLDEDMPDLLGDETVWCVYWDGVEAKNRRYTAVSPRGIEVRQTVFAYASRGALGNIIFIRYRLKNSGMKSDTLKDVYFGVWADPDLGDAEDDLVGVDTNRDAGYVYNDGSDANYGANPPCYIIDFFSGPVAYIPGETFIDNNLNGVYDEGIDVPLDTAYNKKGVLKGIEAIPGAKNLGLSSSLSLVNCHGSLDLNPLDVYSCRNIMLGIMDRCEDYNNPCLNPYGEFIGVDCNLLNGKFWFSGDPVRRLGWINNVGMDQRIMHNTGPFELVKDEEIEIVVAYVVGQGTTPLNSITKALEIDDNAQFIFDRNFQAPEPFARVETTVLTDDNMIELRWPTSAHVNHTDKTAAWDIRFKGYHVYAFRTESTSEEVNNIKNYKLIGSYDIDDTVANVYYEDPNTGGKSILYAEAENKLNRSLYSDPEKGQIRFRMREDPFDPSQPLVKGKKYYLSVLPYGYNNIALLDMDATKGNKSDYLLDIGAFVQQHERNFDLFTVVMGENSYKPPVEVFDAAKDNITGKKNSGSVKVDIVNPEELTGDNYEVKFFYGSAANDTTPYWRLRNTTKDITVIDSSKIYLPESEEIAGAPTLADGFILRIKEVKPLIPDTMTYEGPNRWFKPFAAVTSTDNEVSKIYYLPMGLPQSKTRLPLTGLTGSNNTYTKPGALRRIELRFNQPGKAYRYLNGYIGAAIPRRSSYVYAEGVVDTSGRGPVGKYGEGFVDVPFTAWIRDGVYGEERQLTVGFIEKSTRTGGNPDGIWDPGTQIESSGEYILIFNSTYDASGNQQEYKGVLEDTTVWADLRGYDAKDKWPLGFDVAKAKSAYFDAIYAVALEKKTDMDTYSSSDVFTIPVRVYPYSAEDKFTFKTKKDGVLSEEEMRNIWEKVNVFPNPLFGYNPATSYEANNFSDEPFVTFSNLPPEEITIKIYTISGELVRTLRETEKSSPSSPFLRWDLKNDSGLRVASGMYLAIVSSPKFGDKVLKLAIIMPQKQLQRY